MSNLLDELDAEIATTAARLDALRRARELLGDTAAARRVRAPKVARQRKSLKPPPNPVSGLKVCSACKKEKARAEFAANRGNPDGLSYYCRACIKVKSAARWRAKHPRRDVKPAKSRKPADEEPEPVRAVPPGARRKFRPTSTLPGPGRRMVRCKIDGCGAAVSSHKASQHAWEVHKKALPAGDLALFEDVGAAA